MGGDERLVGRDHARSVLACALARADAGDGRLVLLAGDAGIGKSTVLGWLTEHAVSPCLVLRGFCWEGAGVPPFWPWTQVLRATGLPAVELGEAAWLLDGTGAAEIDGPGAADARFRLFDAVSRCLAKLATGRTICVVIDDLHWADDSSVELLSFASRSLTAARVLLVGAYRDTEAPASLRELATRAEQLPLRGLDLAEVQAMVDGMPGDPPLPEVTTEVWRRTGGNPFYVGELIRLLQAQGSVMHLPASVVEAVRRRLARLSTKCVRLLDWAAVAGRDIDIDLLVDSGALRNPGAALDLLAEARAAGIVTNLDGENGHRFTHDLYRDAIVDAQPPALNQALNLAVGNALRNPARRGAAARVAAHLLRAGPTARREALEHCVLAAREATTRLGHEDACAHYERALSIVDDEGVRLRLLLELSAALVRAGDADGARRSYHEAAMAGRDRDDAAAVAQAALGMQALGHRSGAHDAEVLDLLRDAEDRLLRSSGSPSLRSRVLSALTRALRHSAYAEADPELLGPARRAIELARGAGDAGALAVAKLALHDAMWSLGTAAARLPVVDEMLDAARSAGDADLVAQAHLLRAAALLELGDPAGRDELLTYVARATELGHARGRWGALTRQATYAQIAGRVEEAVRLGAEALPLGRAIGEPDAFGCYATSRLSLVALGAADPELTVEGTDPLWPMLPLLRAWAPAALGDVAAARAALGDFSTLDVAISSGLESLAAAAVVFSAVGSEQQRHWTYEQLRPYAGTHVVVGGCAAYHAAVDHHLGTLAAALGQHAAAREHLTNAIALHERLGAAGWARLSRQALSRLTSPSNEFRLVDGVWRLSYAGRSVVMPDAKGLRDLWTILGGQGSPIHASALLDRDGAPVLGADVVLDARAKQEYRARLDSLVQRIDEAERLGHDERADRLRTERDFLVHELAAATGLGGRPRRLGDQSERARKTVSARVRDALHKIDDIHPLLGAHLREAVRMGTTCAYGPTEPTAWTLR